MKWKLLVMLAVWMVAGGLCATHECRAMSPEERRAYRDQLMKILPEVPAFSDWVKKTDELPPDFDALPKCNNLPDPLKFFDGRPVKTPADWKSRRAEILSLYEKYAWGTVPPRPVLGNVEAQETAGTGYRTRRLVLHFGPAGAEAKGVLHVTMVIPDGKGPFPVLMGPGVIGGLGGNTAEVALRRGYIALSYAGNDFNDDSRALVAMYPEYDFASLARRAWIAGVALDYLEKVPEADMKRVAIFGYSRDGKQAAIAAALDERIGALVAGSTGVGGILPYRLGGERNQAEGIESTTKMFPDWFVPRLRFFVGREDRLPVDGNLLLAAIAPRPAIMISGYNDEVSNDWGDEQSLKSANKVYEFLGEPGRLGIYRVPGFHGANDMEVALDFLDMQFGRSSKKWENHLIFPWDYAEWQTKCSEKVDLARYADRRGADLLSGAKGPIATVEAWEAKASDIRKNIEWMLGDEPPTMEMTGSGIPGRGPGRGGPGAAGQGGRGAGGPGGRGGPAANPGQVTPDLVNWVIQRSVAGTQEFGWFVDENSQTASRSITFGDGVRGQLYYPNNVAPGIKLPAVIWLHSYSYPLGYMWVYRRDLHPILALVKAGYAVLAYDQCGFGSRMAEAGPFYDRWPHWSLMGRMVEDARAGVAALQRDNLVDGDRVYLYGYSMGGMVALHTAALEPRVKGVVSICGFTPMRSDTADKGTGGIARFSIDRPLMPRLGLFVGDEGKIPYDYDEMLGSIAPRPVYIVSPQYDRDATPADVRGAAESARKVYALYHAANELAIDEPWDYNRLATPTQDRAIAWMKEHMK